jgi:hypothetical protein
VRLCKYQDFEMNLKLMQAELLNRYREVVARSAGLWVGRGMV